MCALALSRNAESFTEPRKYGQSAPHARRAGTCDFCIGMRHLCDDAMRMGNRLCGTVDIIHNQNSVFSDAELGQHRVCLPAYGGSQQWHGNRPKYIFNGTSVGWVIMSSNQERSWRPFDPVPMEGEATAV